MIEFVGFSVEEAMRMVEKSKILEGNVEKVTIWIKNHFNEASSFLAAIFILGAVIYVFVGQPVAAGAFSLSAAISILSLLSSVNLAQHLRLFYPASVALN